MIDSAFAHWLPIDCADDAVKAAAVVIALGISEGDCGYTNDEWLVMRIAWRAGSWQVAQPTGRHFRRFTPRYFIAAKRLPKVGPPAG